MTCLQFKSLIDDFVDNELDDRLKQEMLSHIAACSKCKSEYAHTAHLIELLQSNQTSDPGDYYFEESSALIFARTIEKDNWNKANQPNRSEKVQSEFWRALLSAAAALIIFAISIVIGTSEPIISQNNEVDSPIFVMNPVENMTSPTNSPIFTKAEQINHIQGMLLISPPGMLGRLSVIHEYNRVAR